MLKKFWKRLFPEPPIHLGEVVWVPVYSDGLISGSQTFSRMAAGVVCRMYGDGTAEVYVMAPPNPPEYRRLRVLTREESEGSTLTSTTAWRVR